MSDLFEPAIVNNKRPLFASINALLHLSAQGDANTDPCNSLQQGLAHGNICLGTYEDARGRLIVILLDKLVHAIAV